MRPLDPASLSACQRTDEIAALLARGLRRHFSRQLSADPGPQIAPENPPESSQNSLELSDELRLSVHKG